MPTQEDFRSTLEMKVNQKCLIVYEQKEKNKVKKKASLNFLERIIYFL